jgi:hypothetical protein
VRLPTYERTARGLLTDLEDRWLDDLLGRAPRAGTVIPGAGGVRKVRLALPGRGKRGGARVIYYYRGSKERVYLILAYAKSAKANLTRAEVREVAGLVSQLESEP